jgi:phospholipid/cholesterol/gamma-HCH transport system substrate-binding protein
VRRSFAELASGGAVLLVAAGFLAYAVAHTGRGGTSGYTLHARFDHIDGLNVGSEVRVAGVKIGSVEQESIDPKTYLADVSFSVQDDVRLPTDSSAEVTSDGLLGGKYLSLSPGGAEKMIPSGGTVTITQSSVSLEQLLGKFIFSVPDMTSAMKNGAQGGSGQGASGQSGDAQGASPPKAGGFIKPLQ